MDSGMLFLRLVPRPPLCDEAVELADDVRELRSNHRAEQKRDDSKGVEARFSPTGQNDEIITILIVLLTARIIITLQLSSP